MKHLIIIVLLCFQTIAGFSQESGFPLIRNYLPKEYIFSPQVYSALQDNKGIMYFGVTDYGVIEYDGVTWRGIPNQKKTEVYSIAKDKDGIVYITTTYDFGYLQVDNNGKKVYVSLANLIADSTIKIGNVWNVNIIDDDVYFFTEKSIYKYSKEQKSIVSIKPEDGAIFYVPFVFNNEYYALHSIKGIVKVTDSLLIPIPQSTFFIDNKFLSALPFDSTRVLISTRTKGLYLLDMYSKEKKTIKPFNAPSEFIQDNNIYTAIKLEENYLLCSMKKGAILINSNGELLEWYSEKNFLQNDLILGATTDYNNNTWLTLSLGISKIEQSQDFSYWDKNHGLKGNVYDITRYNGILYVATNQQVYFLSRTEKTLNQEKTNSYDAVVVQNIPAGQNWDFLNFKIPEKNNALSEKPNELLLVGTQTGIYQINGSTAQQIYNGELHAFYIYQSLSKPNRIYSTDGFNDFISLQYENGNWISEGKWEGVNDDIRGIIEDSNGDLWLGTFTNGIIRVKIDQGSITKPKQIKYYSKNDGLSTLKGCKPFLFKGKIIWGTEKGIYFYNPLIDRFEPFNDLGEKLCNGQLGVENFLESPNGNVYLSSSNSKDGEIGYLVPTENSQYKLIDNPFHRLPEMASISALHLDSNGAFWIGSNEGLFRYDPSKDIKNYDLGFNCLIRKISVGKDSVIYWGNQEYNQIVPKVDYKNNNIRFDFAAPFFDKEENTKYSYFLDGFDDNWSTWSTTTYKEYTKVKEGSYTFKVKALNIYNKESDIVEYRIKINPPWFRTSWAYLFYSSIVIGIYIFSTRFYSRILISQKQKLERKVLDRTIEIRKQKDEIQSQAEEMAAQGEELQEQAEILKRINEELEKLSIVARETDNAVIIMNENGEFLWVNDGFVRLHGQTLEQYRSKNKSIFESSSSPNIKAIIQECIESKHSVVYESSANNKSGETIYLQTTITPIIDSSGKVEKLVAIDSDISKLKEAEFEIIQKNEEITAQKEELEKHRNHLEEIVKERTEQLVIAKNKAEESDKLKSAFLANMSHEIRTPMNAIIGFSRFLNNTDILPSEKEEFVQLIVNNGNSLLHLIDDIIDIAKIEAGQMTIVKKDCDINGLLNSLFTTFSQKKDDLGSKTNIDLRLKLGVDTISFYIKTDPLRTQQVISNLIDNALKFTDEGFVEFGYEIDRNALKPIMKFYVKDSGIGLSIDEQQQIFGRFTKIENKRTNLYRGAGLGLAICKNIAKLLNGEVYVESELNKGSTFFFSLPLDEVSGQPQKSKTSQMNSVDFNWSGKTMLVAEDERSNFRFIEVLLKRTNVKILHANNGKEAIDIFSNNPIDLILMDIKMPVMDGLEATREIKKLNKEIPIIAQTAYAMQNDENICLDAGCDEYISKPIQPEKLMLLLKKYLS
ncbi:MAG: response regulator [Tenuifilaceae bacterium]